MISLARPCASCTIEFTSSSDTALYCSKTCMRREHERRRRARRRHAHWVAGRCGECGDHFIDRWQGNWSSRYCSLACGRRAIRTRRRALKVAAYVADVRRADIFERDRYRCHLCNRKVRTGVAVPHPLAATLDHVIPLATGGTHEPANVRTAHFLCNSQKGDRGGGEQLALIG